MTEKAKESNARGLSKEELEAQTPEELPDREAMSVIQPFQTMPLPAALDGGPPPGDGGTETDIMPKT